jgi:hypothetical protein
MLYVSLLMTWIPLNLGDGAFIIALITLLLAIFMAKMFQVCTGDKRDPNKAYPNGNYNLKKGDIIDYTWGITNDQQGMLLFSVIPK